VKLLGITRIRGSGITDAINDTPPGDFQAEYIGAFLDENGIAIKDTIAHLEDVTLHTGVRLGLTLSINSDTTFDVAAGEAIIVDRHPNPEKSAVTRILKTATIGILDTNLSEALSHIFMDDVGNITVDTSPPMTLSDINDKIYLGAIVHVGSIIVAIVPDPIIAHGSSSTEMAELVFGGGTKLDGSIISANGANLNLDITNGILRQLGRGFVLNANFPNEVETPASTPVATADFFKVFIDATGDLVGDNGDNLLDPSVINLNGLGTLVSVGGGNFSIIRVFQAGITNDLIFYYGTEAFATISDAQAAIEPTWIEHEDTRDISPVAKIFIQGNTTDLAAGVAGDTVLIQAIRSRTQL